MRFLLTAMLLLSTACGGHQLKTAQDQLAQVQRENASLRTQASVEAKEAELVRKQAEEYKERIELLNEQLSDALGAIGKLNLRLDTYDWILVDSASEECKTPKMVKERLEGAEPQL